MKKICVITGSRAEYGLLRNLMSKFKKSRNIELQVVVTCMHLMRKFGLTYREIENDGFKINYKVRMPIKHSVSKNIVRATALGMIGFSKAFNKLKPDLVVVLGDRFEILSAAFAAHSEKIPIAHIGGGESTTGVIDESIRHSVTKMSSFHFVSTKKYKQRVIQLGENPKNVYFVGALGVDRIKSIKLLSKKDLEKRINFKFGKKNIFVTYHPVSLNRYSEEKNIKAILNSVKKLKDAKIIFSSPNVDSGSDVILKIIKKFVNNNKNKSKLYKSMGDLFYLSSIKHSDLVLGNSSSGIIEAPTLKIPTVNVGDRQSGRIKADSIIDCFPSYLQITKSINKALSEKFKKQVFKVNNPYDVNKSADKIFKILKKINTKNILKKNFYDLSFNNK